MSDIEKYILDACCGGRHMWIQKDNPNTIFMDIRSVPKGTISLQPNWCVEPDIIASYSDMPFDDESFNLINWDIPHKLGADKGLITMKYGHLERDTWKETTALGFLECMRVLKPYGVLVFKFADVSVSFREVLELFPIKPLFGTPTKKGVNNTAFFVFMKDGSQ
jgi:SAM-dependent methyltransferase